MKRTMKKKTRKVIKEVIKRGLVCGVLATLIFITASAIKENRAFYNAVANYEGEFSTHIVNTGDTLWAIANECNNTYNRDIRDIIEVIKADNNIQSNISLGQAIEIRDAY